MRGNKGTVDLKTLQPAVISRTLSPVLYPRRVRGEDAPSLLKAAMRQLGRRSE